MRLGSPWAACAVTSVLTLLAGDDADSVGVVSDRVDFELSVVATLAEAAISTVRLFKRACAESGVAVVFSSDLDELRFAG